MLEELKWLSDGMGPLCEGTITLSPVHSHAFTVAAKAASIKLQKENVQELGGKSLSVNCKALRQVLEKCSQEEFDKAYKAARHEWETLFPPEK